MAQSVGKGRMIGDYLVGRQIGSGSFSVVWHARHRVHFTEVAIKEIATGQLSKKLRESLMSEIIILQKINHPNIIRLHEIIEVPGKIHLVLEYCRGGDLSVYIQRHGRVPEEIAKHFMEQLARGLQVLRDNNLIHRDLKPQNLLLSTGDDRSVLKIADFGFARSLQPRGLAETLCGSPLYMAPEIMQLQKYDAKADLWSVGAILFQLVTGKPPFTGNNQIQLLQNILKSNELQFPPDSKDLSLDCKDLCQKLLRRYPVERLTFDEFFNHSFLSQKVLNGSFRNSKSSNSIDCYPPSDPDYVKKDESSPDECFPFFLEDECPGSGGSTSFMKKSSVEPSKRYINEKNVDKKVLANSYSRMDHPSPSGYIRNSSINKDVSRFDIYRSDSDPDFPLSSADQLPVDLRSREGTLELITDYVIVSGSSTDVCSHLKSVRKPSQDKYQNILQGSTNIIPPLSAQVPNTGPTNINRHCIGIRDSNDYSPWPSLESMHLVDMLEKPNWMIRIKSLQQSASAVKELVNEKIVAGRHLEAFSIQLVILAIWKQGLHICHAQAASDMEGSPSCGTSRLKRSSHKNGDHDSVECSSAVGNMRPEDVSHQIEGEFLQEVERAEQFAKSIVHGNIEMPDAMEMIFQSALALGRRGGVDELMGDSETALSLYSKAVHLLVFLLVEAHSLILNPPFSLTNSDRYRLRNYVEILNSRQVQLRLILKSDDQQCPT
ncbi:hypothetical protein SAY87_026949 [Trapa incisa]|uniref:Protein kinase domain-containing protein n=1 Tax=Trapa incisa TaxID=236973 RepID=A0AAN7JM65_9MYRT|nr:hypothetical protein SAY87_026949 [Trapa incisa]